MSKKFLLTAFAVTTIFGLSGAGAYAVNALDFTKPATAWQEENCTEQELNRKRAREQSAICKTLNSSSVNTAEIAKLKSTATPPQISSNLYTLLDNSSSIYANTAGYNSINLKTMVPKDGKITTITLVNNSYNNYKTVESGTISFNIVVNGIDKEFGSFLDSENINNIATNGDIPVKAGDIVGIRATTSPNFKITNDSYNMYSFESNIGLFVESNK